MHKIHVMPFIKALPNFDGVGTNNIAKDIIGKVIQNK